MLSGLDMKLVVVENVLHIWRGRTSELAYGPLLDQ